MEEVLAELKYLRRDEPTGTPQLAPFEVQLPQAIDARGHAVPPGASAAAAALGAPQPPPPPQRSVYLDHSASTYHGGSSLLDGSLGMVGEDGSSVMEGAGTCPFGHQHGGAGGAR